MNYSPASILTGYLVGTNLVQLPQDGVPWPAFTPSMPEDGDQAICTYDTAGRMDGRCMRGPVQSHPGFQIRIRAMDAPTGYDFAYQLMAALDAVLASPVTMDDGTTYVIQAIKRTTDVIHLGEEPERGRTLWTINGLVTVQLLEGP